MADEHQTRPQTNRRTHVLLCEATGLTLDWIYRGRNAAADPKVVNRLNRRVEMLRDAD